MVTDDQKNLISGWCQDLHNVLAKFSNFLKGLFVSALKDLHRPKRVVVPDEFLTWTYWINESNVKYGHCMSYMIHYNTRYSIVTILDISMKYYTFKLDEKSQERLFLSHLLKSININTCPWAWNLLPTLQNKSWNRCFKVSKTLECCAFYKT